MRKWSLSKVAGFFYATKSSIAVEFALIAPILILLGLAAIEFSATVRVQLSADRTARTIAFLIANTPTPINAAQMADYYIAGIDSYQGPASNIAVSAASFVYYPIGATTGSDAANSTVPADSGWDAGAHTAGFTSSTTGKTYYYATTPASVFANGASNLSSGTIVDSVIAVQATAVYSLPFLPNFFGKIPMGPFTFTSTAFARPRQSLIIAESW
jgi:Flp pilus assembly protein TadG